MSEQTLEELAANMSDEEKREAIFALAEQRAYQHFDSGNWESAQRDYLTLTRLRPDFARYWAMLGVASLENDERTYGAKCLQQAVELDPDYTEAWLHLGEALCLLAQFDKGLEVIRRVYEENKIEGAEPEAQPKIVKRAGATLAAMLTARKIARENTEDAPS